VLLCACAFLRLCESLMFSLISSPNRNKRKGLHTVVLFVSVATWHHWRRRVADQLMTEMWDQLRRTYYSMRGAGCA